MNAVLIVNAKMPVLLQEAGLSNSGSLGEAMNSLVQIAGCSGVAKVSFIDFDGDALIIICTHRRYQELYWYGKGRGWVGMKTGDTNSAEQIRVEFHQPRMTARFA